MKVKCSTDGKRPAALDGLPLSDTLAADGSVFTLAEKFDIFGRSEGYALSNLTVGAEALIAETMQTYDTAGRLGSVAVSGAGVFAYDAAGNVTSIVSVSSVRELVWNGQRQLVSVSTNGAFAESYAYDALGRRISTTDSSGIVFHVYDGDECVADVDASGNPLRSYTWGQGIDDLLAMTVYSDYGGTASVASVYYAVKDHLGSVHALVDASGQIAASYTYDAWGNLLSHFSTLELSNFPCRYLFQGREYSAATGLYNFRARWYAPEIGRWLSNDPIGISGGLNLYEFCANNPVNFLDPDGLELVTHGDKRTEAALDAIDQALQKNLDKANSNGRGEARRLLREFRHIRKDALKPIPINPSKKPNRWNPVNPFDNNDDNTIDWNPDCETGGKNDKDGKRPPYVGLAHEISHAIDFIFSRGGNDEPKNRKYAPTRGDERALDFENAVRNGAGLPRRETYYDNIK